MLALGIMLGWALTVVVSSFVNPWRGRHRSEE